MKMIIRTMVLVFAVMAFASAANAQKFAHVNTDSLVKELAIKDSVQQKLDVKQAEFELQIKQLENEYKIAEADYNNKSSRPDLYSKSVIQLAGLKKQDIADRANQYAQVANQELQEYELELMEPLVEKIKKAIDEVAKEKGYAYVINDQVLLVSPPSDDITNLVRKKLGL